MDHYNLQYPTLPWTHLVWFKSSIPKHSFTLWVAIQQKLPTLDRRCTAHINSTICILCNAEPESYDHLFFSCSFVQPLWKFLQARCGFYIQPISWTQLIAWASFHCRGISDHHSNTVSKMTLASLVYNIWIERNMRIFKRNARSANSLLHITLEAIRSKILSSTISDTFIVNRVATEWELPESVIRPAKKPPDPRRCVLSALLESYSLC
ncbi:uncharacterized protein LOC132301510 [Cornus florida]|uniref:uncharacterized protein LOC132301510 n=1 Tax=Cornus florida TaxID=4283 RepID=UPI0028A05F91|nr:uncharacterized protein LOC132301510 [Cornus florida]